MESEGFTNEFLRTFNWDRPDFPAISQEDMDRIEEPTARFFMAHTKDELLEGAVKYKVMLYPVSTAPDMLTNRQLVSRNFWVTLDHPELSTALTYPGSFALFSESSAAPRFRAPLIGEHNLEIYEKEFGISHEQLGILKQAGII
jgi:crotonobetainyl-CoA:carnitine CoA-transferase CaiB-like acyl-CoA transferase